MAGVSQLLARGQAWTFASVAKAAAVPERTVYRYFPTREALLEAIFDWANERLGFSGEPPESEAELRSLVQRCFPGFDALAPVVRELLLAPEGRLARLKQKQRRQRASLSLVQREAPHLPPAEARRLAAVLQLLGQAGTWHALREYWDMDGAEAAQASALAIELLLAAARLRRAKPGKRAKLRRRSAGARRAVTTEASE